MAMSSQNQPMSGFLGRLFGSSPPTPASHTKAVTATLYSGYQRIEVVGESHYQDALWRIVGGRRREPVSYETHAVLMPEPNDSDYPNAIRVLVGGLLVGYLSHEDAALYRPGLLRLMETNDTGLVSLDATIVGGGPREDGIGFLGVFLDHNPADFGVAQYQVAGGHGIRTGLGEALATAREDDRYDLSWCGELSANDITAVKQLRSMLDTTRTPIDRHYMLCELEARLYKSRDAFASALDEFDEVCRQHDAEMVTIRPALLDKFSAIPVIDMYRQAAVRWQKAKDWEAMRDWAQRGISVYGEHAARAEVVEDLQKRVAKATAKIEAANRSKTGETHD
jgi:hypothetical protein